MNRKKTITAFGILMAVISLLLIDVYILQQLGAVNGMPKQINNIFEKISNKYTTKDYRYKYYFSGVKSKDSGTGELIGLDNTYGTVHIKIINNATTYNDERGCEYLLGRLSIHRSDSEQSTSLSKPMRLYKDYETDEYMLPYLEDGYTKVNIDGKTGLINADAQLVIQPRYYDLGELSDGLISFSSQGNLYGYLNLNGDIVIPEKYSNANPFSDGLAEVTHNSKTYCIDKDDNIHFEKLAAGVSSRKFSEGLLEFETEDNRVGFLDRKGKIVIQPIYYSIGGSGNLDRVSDFHNGYALVSTRDPYSGGGQSKDIFINKQGENAFQKEFESASSFSKGLAYVTINGQSGYIDTKGKWVNQEKATQILNNNADPKASIINLSTIHIITLFLCVVLIPLLAYALIKSNKRKREYNSMVSKILKNEID